MLWPTVKDVTYHTFFPKYSKYWKFISNLDQCTTDGANQFVLEVHIAISKTRVALVVKQDSETEHLFAWDSQLAEHVSVAVKHSTSQQVRFSRNVQNQYIICGASYSDDRSVRNSYQRR